MPSLRSAVARKITVTTAVSGAPSGSNSTWYDSLLLPGSTVWKTSPAVAPSVRVSTLCSAVAAASDANVSKTSS